MENVKYAVIRIGGMIVETSNNKEIAKQIASLYRSRLTPGEKSYYGMSYVTREVK